MRSLIGLPSNPTGIWRTRSPLYNIINNKSDNQSVRGMNKRLQNRFEEESLWYKTGLNV